MESRAPPICESPSFLARLARDSGGNTLALIAASIAPILAMVGGGVDMGRSYLAQARLQQACDAGVLAARKRLGPQAAVTGTIPEDAGLIGQRFFNVNYRAGAYGTTDRSFVMALESDFAVSGVATVTVPTTIMRIFGFEQVPLKVECEAQINFSNTDVMMVLDVTGSMGQTNPGDSAPRIDVLKSTVKGFYQQLQAATAGGTRVRYGFLPYSTNVNVGGLLKDEWVVKSWRYQSRELRNPLLSIIPYTHETEPTYISGSKATSESSSYSASYDSGKGYYCPTGSSDNVSTSSSSSSRQEIVVLPYPGVKTTETLVRTRNGYSTSVTLQDTTCRVLTTTYSNYKDTYQKITEPILAPGSEWVYKSLPFDVSNWRAEGNGCIEERATYDITNYDNVDLARAIDLDIDRVPTEGNPATQWRPMYPALIYARSLEWTGSGDFTSNEVISDKEFVSPLLAGTAACPAPARNLAVMTSAELDTYLATLNARGSTYHDIGMIWGARLISPSGIFADRNADASPDAPSNRNLIFLTDGETAPYDLSYSSYGIEPIDARRWSEGSSLTLVQTVEKRFAFACNEVKKRNITVWVIGFGVALNPVMKDCAGEGHYFEAADAAELNASFASIAKKMSNLRIER